MLLVVLVKAARCSKVHAIFFYYYYYYRVKTLICAHFVTISVAFFFLRRMA